VGLGFIGFFLLAWILVTALGLVPRIFLPSPTAVINELIRQIQSGILWQDASTSLYRIFIGWLISTLVAVPIGILMGNFHFFEGLFEPFIDLVRYMPAVAFVPLTILWLGVGDTQKYAILFIGTFFQEVLLIMDNVKTVPRELIQISSTFGLNKWEILRDVILRAAMPGIWDTFRITLGWAWTYLVVAELVAASVGLGYRIMRAQRFLETETIILGILIIGFMGLITDYIFKISYKKLFRWALQSR
jgi:NitT/TauT family transport system permease protein